MRALKVWRSCRIWGAEGFRVLKVLGAEGVEALQV
jgi:hypothetical protein